MTSHPTLVCCSSMIQVGQRIQHIDSRHFATVAFVGAVADATGAKKQEGEEEEWVGVVWDEEGRGKHDGMVGGVRYFTAPAMSASFLRAYKIAPTTTFEAAVVHKYASQDAADAETEMKFRDRKKGQAAVVAVLVGKEKAEEFFRTLTPLTILTLQDTSMHCRGVEGWARQHVPNCENLDLGENVFTHLQSVAEIAVELPKLTSLRLSGNRFVSLDVHTANAFQALSELVLNATMITWQQIQILAPHLPRISRLHLGSNNLTDFATDVPLAEGAWKELRFLNLECNKIENWASVVPLSSLPNLTQLVLNDNLVSHPSPGACFVHLQQLLLGNNRITTWEGVECINEFPRICDIRLSGNPVFESAGQAVSRQGVIARLGGVATLNGAAVRPRERDDAEKMYLTRVISDAGDIANVDGAVHPRFAALLEKWGAPIMSIGGAAADSGGGSMIAVTIRSNVAASMAKAPAQKKLPPSTTVGALKRICHQVFRVEVSKQRLFWRQAGDVLPDALEDDLKTLQYYGVTSGCEVLVEEVIEIP